MQAVYLFLLVLVISVGLRAADPAGEPAPFREFLQAMALDETLDSIQMAWEWEEIQEDNGAPELGFKARAKYVFRDGFVAESESMYGIIHPEMKLPMQLSYTRDGYYYTRPAFQRSGEKNKRPAEQIPAGLDPLSHGVLHFPLEEQFIAGQQRSGNVLRFTVDVAALNALQEGTASAMNWREAAFEAELDKDGKIRTMTASGLFTRIGEDGKEVLLRHRGTLEILQRGGIAISFPADLDSYAERN